MKIKPNDIYRWSYSADFIKGRFEPYWAVSRYAICRAFSDGELYLEDSFWSCGDNRRFYQDDVDNGHVELKFLGNFDELEKLNDNPEYYKPEDIVNLNHANSSRDNIYIRKGATRDINIIRKLIQDSIESQEIKIQSLQKTIELNKKQLNNLTEDNKGGVCVFT